MFKRWSQFWERILLLSDLFVITFAWVMAYHIRSTYNFGIYIEKGTFFNSHLDVLIPILFLWSFIFKWMGLYRPRRVSTHISEFLDILKASTITVLILIAFTFFVKAKGLNFSRYVMFYFWLFCVVGLTFERAFLREILRYLRRNGYNIRRVLVVGAGELGSRVVNKIKDHPWTGLVVVGYLDNHKHAGETVDNVKVLGRINDINHICHKFGIDQIFIALPVKAYNQMMYVLENLCDDCVNIMIVPDIYQAVTLNANVDEFDGLPLINLTDTPLYGWNAIVKRSVDTIFSIIAIILTSPFMIVISVLVKLTSPGPVFYKQERMGLDGRRFNILKFRSMKIDAEENTGAVWTRENDTRRTRFGAFLRKTSLDELPQFFNVLMGDMSIVGPRPERPVFIEKFRKEVPRYMLRHKMRAGITGWAQVNGWRGNTSLKKRIEYDLYYIENWSIWFDLKIMWLTAWKGLLSKNAY